MLHASPNVALVTSKYRNGQPIAALNKNQFPSYSHHRISQNIAVTFVISSIPISSAPTLTLTSLNSQGDDADKNQGSLSTLSENDQILLGAAGTTMSLIVLVSEYVLKTTGCGLAAGPYGIVGAAEGISYLGVTALVAFSLYTKVKSGSGLPAGPKGVLGLAEGLGFLAVVAGVIVLVFQVLEYGYVPNAVPMEGGMCQ